MVLVGVDFVLDQRWDLGEAAQLGLWLGARNDRNSSDQSDQDLLRVHFESGYRFIGDKKS